MSALLPLLIATLIPIVVLYVIYSLDLYQSGDYRYVLGSFAWGLAAFAGAYALNRGVYFSGTLDRSQIVRYFAPVAEEILKALVLIYLVRRPNFTYFVDGAIYGFAAGMGFAIAENYQYILSNPSTGMGTAIGRVLGANLVHASATASVGAVISLTRFRKTPLQKAGLILAGLAGAAALHSLFNHVNDGAFPGPTLVYSTVIGLLGVGLIAAVIFRGLAIQKTWIEENLGMADRVSDQEARVVRQYADVHELLKPLAQLYGEEKAGQVEKFLGVQAKIGIKRKTLQDLSDEKLRAGVEAEITRLQVEMDQARKTAGPYVMMSVRSIFPEEGSPVYDLMQRRIEASAAVRPASGGMNVWANLGQRAQAAAQTAGPAQAAAKTAGKAGQTPAAPLSGWGARTPKDNPEGAPSDE